MKEEIIKSYSRIIHKISRHYELKGEDFPDRYEDLKKMLDVLSSANLNSTADLRRIKYEGKLGFIGGKYLGRGEIFSDLERAGCFEKSDFREFAKWHDFLIEKTTSIDWGVD